MKHSAASRGTVVLKDFAACDFVIEAIVGRTWPPSKSSSPPWTASAPRRQFSPRTPRRSAASTGARLGDQAAPTRCWACTSSIPLPVMPAAGNGSATILVSDETFATGAALRREPGQRHWSSPKTIPGFIVNLLLIPYLLDAVQAPGATVSRHPKRTSTQRSSLASITRWGPLTLLDFVGLDTTLFIADAMYEEFRDRALRRAPAAARMVTAGLLGRKSGRGFLYLLSL